MAKGFFDCLTSQLSRSRPRPAPAPRPLPKPRGSLAYLGWEPGVRNLPGMLADRWPQRRLQKLPPEVRGELLLVLTREPHVRADAIRQFYERPEGRHLAEVLMDLEADDVLRWRVVDLLRDLDD